MKRKSVENLFKIINEYRETKGDWGGKDYSYWR